MRFDFTPQDDAFREGVRSFLDREVTPDVVADLGRWLGPGEPTKALYRKLGARGWLTPTWPRRYGGMDGTYLQRLILAEELAYRRAYFTHVGPGMAGPVLLMFGSDDLKEEFLPRISAAEIEFSLGYTEPGAGSDLASLQMTAVVDGDDFVINGTKVFSSATHYADYHWLAVRTEPDLPRHRGVSLILVDLETPGITYGPLWTLNHRRTNIVHYDNVRVPKRYLIGERGKGFYYIATALDFERMWPAGDLMRDLDDFVAWFKSERPGEKMLAREPLARQRLGEMAVLVDTCRLLTYHIAWLLDRGTIPNYQTSMLKVFISETRQRFARLGAEIVGPLSMLKKASRMSVMEGYFPHYFLEGYIGNVVAGSSEIQRHTIATRGLGLPRS